MSRRPCTFKSFKHSYVAGFRTQAGEARSVDGPMRRGASWQWYLRSTDAEGPRGVVADMIEAMRRYVPMLDLLINGYRCRWLRELSRSWRPSANH